MLDRAWRLGAALLLAALASGCANLEAVRDFGKRSAQLAGYTEVTERYLGGPERLQGQVPAGPEFERDRQWLASQAQAVQAEKDSLLKLHGVVSGYMAALAQLAGEHGFEIAPQFDKVTGALAEAPHLGLERRHVQAFGTIASKVGSWLLAARQARDVKAMVQEHGEAMDTLLEAMAIATAGMCSELDNERGRMASWHDVQRVAFLRPVALERPGSAISPEDRQTLLNRNAALLAWGERAYAPVRAEQDKAVASAQAALRGVQAVRRGHDELRREVDHLGSAELAARLKALTADLDAVRGKLKDL